MDLRGYGASDKPPRGYDTITLAADVAAVVRSLGAEQAVVAGHDWGGWVAWSMPALQPSVTRAVAPMSIAHPLAFSRAVRRSNAQRAASAYVLPFQPAGAAGARAHPRRRPGHPHPARRRGSRLADAGRRGPRGRAGVRRGDAGAVRGAQRDGVLPLGGALGAAGRRPPVPRGGRPAGAGAGAAPARRARPGHPHRHRALVVPLRSRAVRLPRACPTSATSCRRRRRTTSPRCCSTGWPTCPDRRPR
nr:alpha/beta fold hydrolase [Angustibacter aerolatus]